MSSRSSLIEYLVIHCAATTTQVVPSFNRISCSPERRATHSAGRPFAISPQFRVIHRRPSGALKRSGAMATTVAVAMSSARRALAADVAAATTNVPAAIAVPVVATATFAVVTATVFAAPAADTATPAVDTATPATVPATLTVALTSEAPARTTLAPVSMTAQPARLEITSVAAHRRRMEQTFMAQL